MMSDVIYLPITKGFLEREGNTVTISFPFGGVGAKRRADEVERAWKTALEKTCCPSCRILWEQTTSGRMRHCAECRWPEILMERNAARIAELQAKNAKILEEYPPKE